MQSPLYPLAEEIGDPDLFVGRRSEMARLLQWAEDSKWRRSRSMGILSRRKKGKTALLQRFYNILYDKNDPQLIPFYYRVPQDRVTKEVFATRFYQRVLTQYFAFTNRAPELANGVLSFDELRQFAAADRSPTTIRRNSSSSAIPTWAPPRARSHPRSSPAAISAGSAPS